MLCYVMLCYVRTSSLADIQALVFLLIHSQNVNWITTAQINPRHEKMQISFYINQFNLWNNSMFLERICFFFLFYSVHVSLFVYLFSFIWRTKRSKIWIFLFILFPIYLCSTSSLIKKGQELKKYLRDLTRTRVTKISRISWMLHLPVNWFLQWRAIFFPSWPPV